MKLINNIYNLIQIFQIFLILPTTFALNELCNFNGNYGVCVDINDCKLVDKQEGIAVPKPNLCNGDKNIQCCIKVVSTLRNGNSLSISGNCKYSYFCPNNYRQYYNECPGDRYNTLCVSNESIEEKSYFFAVGSKEIEFIKDIKEGNKKYFLDEIPKYKAYYEKFRFTEDEIISYANTALDYLKTSYLFTNTINIMNLKHIGIYLGSKEKGRLFEFDNNGWHVKDYTMEKLDEDHNDPNKWNWTHFKEFRGYTRVSPESLEDSLNDYKEVNRYFNNKSYNLFCNNCHDFVKWCLEIITMGKRLVEPESINIIKDNYTFNTNEIDNKKAAENINTIISDIHKKFRAKGSGVIDILKVELIYYFLVNIGFKNNDIINIKYNDHEICAGLDYINLLREKNYNDVCKSYDYSGLINSKATINGKFITSSENFSNFIFDNDLCLELNSSDIVDKSDDINGTENFNDITFTNIFIIFTSVIFLELFNLY
ncbi:hypothetical protein BCR36DRAFT_413124 [Piromyces finnis]|uniref:Uncharacterized protein n=1 Tax=Piromyces finnis TaxID=1754191 RepID=A0A1Y1V6Z2_9FUNG|nr:hypothetical protein BCR36DRAFT_413124 [Piromyces finnis]|eukprot:ORX48714.1 hypothetical protein BCR36DRAFT_413124 [Piromyces finnis]